MTEARTVTRIVKGPKSIVAYDSKGKKRTYAVGDEVQLPPHAAKSFARYLTTPELAAAEQAVKDAEEKAAAEEARVKAAEEGDGDGDTNPSVLSVAEKAALANKEKADAEAADDTDDD